ncbi:MAG: hypothetical protein WCO86_19510, partial [Planctomycetota bacterium]
MTALLAGKEIPRPSFFVGWVVSLALHIAVFFIVGITLRGCQQASMGQAGGEVFRDVGLFVVPGVDDGTSNVGLASGTGDSNVTQPVQEQQPNETTTDNSVPDHQRNRVPMEAPDIASLLNDNSLDSAFNTNGASNS